MPINAGSTKTTTAIRFDFFIDAENVRERFAELVRAQADELNANLKKVIHSLTPIQSAVIRVMGSMGDSYAPFEAPTMALYAAAMKQAGIAESDIKVEVPGGNKPSLPCRKRIWCGRLRGVCMRWMST